MVSRAASRLNKSSKKGQTWGSKATSKKATNAKANGFVRIIAGKWKGKKLPVQDLNGLRPTTDRVKETLFNWLMFETADKKVLDCFAGSGSLGFEALSRGASQVTLLEKAVSAAKQLSQNADALSAEQTQVINNDSLAYLARPNTNNATYDLVFIDPPFRQDLAATCCQKLEQQMP